MTRVRVGPTNGLRKEQILKKAVVEQTYLTRPPTTEPKLNTLTATPLAMRVWQVPFLTVRSDLNLLLLALQRSPAQE